MYKSMFRPEVIRRVKLCFFRPCKTSILASDVRDPPRRYLCSTLNLCLYKPGAMCLSLLHFQPCAGSEPDCNCRLSNKYTYMQLRSPEVTRVNFHLTHTHTHTHRDQSLKYDHIHHILSITSTYTHITHTKALYLSVCHSLSLTHTHTHTHTHSHTHTHTHTHTL